MEYEQEDRRKANADRRRLGSVKASAIVAVIGLLMILIGNFAGEETGNQDSSRYFVSLIGLMLLMGAFTIWLLGSGIGEAEDKKK